MAARHKTEQQLGFFRYYRTRRGDQLRLVRMARGAALVPPPGRGSPIRSAQDARLEAIRNKRTSIKINLDTRYLDRCRPLSGGAGRQRFTWRQAAEVVVGVLVLVGLWAGVAFWMAIVEAGRFGWTQ